MINYSINKNLNLPIKLFFSTVRRVRNYKNFVPWCLDSWETKGEIFMMKYEEVMKKFPSLYENKMTREKLKSISNNDNQNMIKLKQYEGGIKIGFNILDFSYSCNIISIEPNIVLSVTEGRNSHIFKKLESLWIINQKNNHDDNIQTNLKNTSENINQNIEQNLIRNDSIDDTNQSDTVPLSVDYFINFEFKSIVFSHVTNLFLLFLGDNIMKAFISKCESELGENKKELDDFSEDLNFVEILDNRIRRIHFDSCDEKESIRDLLVNLHRLNKLNINELIDYMSILEINQSYVKKLAFLSEIAVWTNTVQIEKIKNELMSH